MKIAIAQINTSIGDLEGNISKIVDYYSKLSKKTDLIIFPELAICSYPLIDLLDREDFVIKQLDLINKELLPIVGDCAMIVGGISKNINIGKQYFNSAFFIYKHKILNVTNKTLLPSYDMFDERRYFEKASSNDIIEFKGYSFGISICEDIWKNVSTEFSRLYEDDPIEKLSNVDVLINISSSPFYLEKDKIRHKILSNYSKNKTLIYVNSVGANDNIIFDGRSKVYKDTNLFHECKSFCEDSFVFDIDFSKNIDANSKISVDLNKDLLDALSLGVKDYIKKNNLKNVLIGLSGGLDSAICTVIACKALGKDNVVCITMPSVYSSTASVLDSEKLCANLGVKLLKVDINNVFNEYIKTSKDLLNIKLQGLAKENIQSRIRALYLNLYANTYPGTVILSTGNKSEIATGYCTLYGDTCGALSVIGDLYKTQVYKLAKYINQDKIIIPQNIINKKPSAELKENQNDEDSLGSYEILDDLLKKYIEEYFTYEELCDFYDKDYLKKIIKLININEFKRKQMPPILKVSKKTFNVDRKWSIVNKYF